jgi:hypothetical protein
MKPTGCDSAWASPPLMSPCSEQGELPAAKAFTLAERDNNMSEQKSTGFMEELDRWTDANVVMPAFNATQDDWEAAVAQVKLAIREKVLESFNWRGSGVWGQSKGCPFSFCSQGLPEISAYV